MSYASRLAVVVAWVAMPIAAWSSTYDRIVSRAPCTPGAPVFPDCTLWTRTPPIRWLAPDLAVEDVAFGITRERDDGAREFVETRTVPFSPGQLYGYTVVLHTGRDRVRLREELTMPAPPAIWVVTPSSSQATIAPDRRSVVVEEQTDQRRATRFWSIDRGDPRGAYKLRLYIEDVLIGEATFIVGQPQATKEDRHGRK